ncbi:MAG: TOBE domain-containing protein [Chloroflexi bacterium]|nr:TOBE domain-containing protein [Chloroflexota bacterium]
MTIRPERIQFAGQETENRICGAVERRQFMGTTHRDQVRISGDVLLTVDTSSLRAETGETVSLYFPPEDLWLMRRQAVPGKWLSTKDRGLLNDPAVPNTLGL